MRKLLPRLGGSGQCPPTRLVQADPAQQNQWIRNTLYRVRSALTGIKPNTSTIRPTVPLSRTLSCPPIIGAAIGSISSRTTLLTTLIQQSGRDFKRSVAAGKSFRCPSNHRDSTPRNGFGITRVGQPRTTGFLRTRLRCVAAYFTLSPTYRNIPKNSGLTDAVPLIAFMSLYLCASV